MGRGGEGVWSESPINRMNVDRALNGLLKLAIALAVVAGVALSVVAVVDAMHVLDREAAERRALVQRSAELNLGAMQPGSALVVSRCRGRR